MDNLKQFTATLDRFQVQSEKAIPLIQKKLGLEALRRLVMRTPVDTGRARGNWQASINQPASGQIARLDPSGQSAVAEGGKILSAPPFCEVWISNNLPYIEALEDGHSGQAPFGMLRPTFTELVLKYSTVAEQVLRELKL